MSRLDSFMDSGSNYNFKDKLMPPNQRVSQFDLSYINNFTAKQGEIIPCWFSYYYPNDDIGLTIDNLLRVVNVPVVPLMSRMRVFFHMFKIDYSQMWDIWDTFMKKGWSGNFEAVLPTLSAPLLSMVLSTPCLLVVLSLIFLVSIFLIISINLVTKILL